MNVGENIRKIRKEKNKSAKYIAEKVGCSTQAILQYERGERNPSINTLEKICNALNVNLMDIIEGKEHKGLKVTVKLTETDIVKNIIRMLKQVALDERIDKNIRDEYLADLSEQIGFDIVINDKPTDFKLDKNTHDNIMQKFTKVE
ncbi:helix-turn-helix domain-containing protein [Intestinibacter bartlettii]|uniref:helix-turn-helix domain-containing protein n=1 Tax=Intestinibacter bartlettii TaxID=261299 RepID=UPI002676FCE4|nr:helix-turn-helix transcriptional regulator [Intestinibacter bartlettii]